MSFDAASRRVLANVWINNATYPVRVRSIDYRVDVNSDENRLLPGCTACASIDVKVHGEIAEDLTGQSVRIGFNAFDVGSSGNAKMITLGTFTITGQETVTGTGATVIHATDVMAKLDKTDYVSSLSFPASTSDIIAEIRELTGVAIYWDNPGTSTPPANLPVQEKPVGYTCKEVLGHIAGMFGRYAIDCFHVATSNVFYGNAIVLRYYTENSVTIPPSLIHRDGFELKNAEMASGAPVVYVECKVNVTEDEPSKPPEDADPTDIRCMQNPDELKDELNFKPYWVIAGPINVTPGVIPEYTVFFTDTPATFFWETGSAQLFGDRKHVLRSQNMASTYATNHAWNTSEHFYDWIVKGGGLIQEYDYDYVVIDEYTNGGIYNEVQEFHIVASNYDVYSTDGTLLRANNGEVVGSLRDGASVGGVEVIYGEGDYTNPLIDDGNLAAVQSMQRSVPCWPGSVKWRGDPGVRPGTKISVVDREGKTFTFLICSLSLHYDGGMYMVAECHGSADMFNKKIGIQKELTKIRGLKAVWEATNTEDVV